MANIVYLDDEKCLTDIFELVFEDSAHTIMTFNHENDAITYCQHSPPDILFVDYRLESMLGDAVAHQLPHSIAVVLVTGDLKVESDFIFSHIINKPFKLDELVNVVEKLGANEHGN